MVASRLPPSDPLWRPRPRALAAMAALRGQEDDLGRELWALGHNDLIPTE